MSNPRRIPWQDQRGVAQFIGAHLDWQHRLQKGPGRLDVVGVSFADLKLHTLWLQKARFRDCDFSRVYATAANFNGSTFERCNFTDMDGESMQFEGSTLLGCDFSRSRIGGTSFGGHLESTRFDQTDMQGANFFHAVATGLELSTTDFFGGKVIGSTLVGCNLRGRDLSRGYLVDAQLQSGDLRDINWGGADLNGARFVECLFSPGGGKPAFVDNVILEACRLDPDGEPLTDEAMRAALGW